MLCTPSKESTLERRCDGYMDLAGCSLWDSPATLSAQLRGSLPGHALVTRMGSSKTSVGLSGTSTKFSSASLSIASANSCGKQQYGRFYTGLFRLSGPHQCSADADMKVKL